MNEKRFKVRFEQEDGRGEIVNEKGVELTSREAVNCLNELVEENNRVMDKLNELVDENGELKKKNVLLREEFIGIIHLLVNENDELTKKLDNAIDIARLNQETVKKLLNKLSKYWDDG